MLPSRTPLVPVLWFTVLSHLALAADGPGDGAPPPEGNAPPPAAHGRRGPDSAATPAPLTGKALERHAGLVAKAKLGGYGLVLIGDSITDWWPGRGKSSWAKLAPYHPLNLGWAGQHTEHVLWRIRQGELDGLDPRLVMILIGTNNLGHIREEQPAWVAGGVAAILADVRQRLPKAQVLVLGILPRGRAEDPIRARVKAVNEALRGLAAPPAVTYLDLGSRFVAEDGSLPKDLLGDGLHPTGAGYELWYQGIKPILDRTFTTPP